MEAAVFSLKGIVVQEGDALVLRMPLNPDGSGLIENWVGVAEIEGDVLKINIPRWLAEFLRVRAGDVINVTNQDGRANIFPPNPQRPN
jgi:hypothetical protein